MRTLHIVSHTHWDREWYRPFQAFRLRLVHLIDGLLDLLEKDPDFKYFMLDGQTIVLDDYLAMRPEKEEDLRRYIQKGRIIIGPWHILPDMFLVGPEAHIRNLLQGHQTSRKFGPKMSIGYIPDPFGHPGQVPQILHGFGIQTACVWRGLDDQPTEFWWQSPDGTRVLMANLRDSYSNGASLPADDPAGFIKVLTTVADSLAAHSSIRDYLIMYGTDHMEPPPDTSKAIAYADKSMKETRVIHSTLPKFLAAVQEDIKRQSLELPTFNGELRACKRMHLLPGVLSTRIWIKQRNHACENLLLKWVEPFVTWQEQVVGSQSGILNQKSSLLKRTWRLLMQNHPHDSICGCSIDQVHDEMKVRFDQVEQIGEELTRQSLETIAGAINTQPKTEGQKSAIVIFNPNGSMRTDIVSVTMELPSDVEAFDLVDEQGTRLPHQSASLAGQEIISMIMDSKGLQSTFGYISDGRAAGMTIQDVKIRREAAQVFIDAVMSEGGEPNLAAWKAGLKTIEEIFADPAVKEYHVRARYLPATRIQFVAREVPALGYRTFWLLPRTAEEKAPVHLGGPLVRALLPLARLPFLQRLTTRPRNAKPPYRIENEFFVVEAGRDGTLKLLDKRDNKGYTGLNAFTDGGDCGDEYNYSPPETDRFVSPRLKRAVVEHGPVQQSLELMLELKVPLALTFDRKIRSKGQVRIPVSTKVSLTNSVPRVDISTTIENKAMDHRLRVHFPAPFSAETGSHDGHFEVVERRIGIPAFDDSWVESPRPEVPQRAFTDISDGISGLMLANRGLPEVEVLKNRSGNAEIALTLLRCVGWLSRDDFSTRKGHAGPSMETPGAQMAGKWTFDYSIIPHSGSWQNGFQHAYSFEVPLRGVNIRLHGGELPAAGSFVEASPETFVISAVKPCEDGDGWLVRGFNITGEAISVTLKPWKPFRKVALVNLAEQKSAKLKPDRTGAVTFPVRGHEIVTIRLRD